MRRRRLGVLGAFLLLLGSFTAVPARASAVTDTITVSIGYFGWSADQYIEKASYSWQELDGMFGGALDTYYTAYSYYSGSRTAVDSARGILIEDLLNYAGIDLTSVYGISFFTLDYDTALFTSFTKNDLLYGPRYYFPNIWASDDDTADSTGGALIARDGGDLWEGAVTVPSMLALEDNWEWEAVSDNFSSLSTSCRFRLVFGQSGPEDARTSQSAKYVYRVHVSFFGSPELSMDETDRELKVGSDYKVSVNVAAEDALLDDYVRQNILWSSSDPSVVQVDQNGQLTVVGAGEATVTASFGDAAASLHVSVGEEENLSGGGAGGAGMTSGTGDAAGAGATGPAEPDDAGEAVAETPAVEAAGEITPPPDADTAELPAAEDREVLYILSADAAARLGMGAQDTREDAGMASDAVQLTVQEQEISLPAGAMAAFVCICLGAGALTGVLKYIIESRGFRICRKARSK